MKDNPTIGTVAMGDTEAAMVTPEMTKAALAAYRLNARSMIQTRSLDVYETELMHRILTAALSTRPAQEPVAELPQDVINLVIAAREFWDDSNDLSSESRALDKALGPFSERVPCENEPEQL